MSLNHQQVVSSASSFLSGNDLARQLGISAGRASQLKEEIRAEAEADSRFEVQVEFDPITGMAEPRAVATSLDRKIDDIYDSIELKAASGVLEKMEQMLALGKPMELLKVAAMANGLKRRTGILKPEAAPGAITIVQIQVGKVLQPKLKTNQNNEIIEVNDRAFTSASNAQVLDLATSSASIAAANQQVIEAKPRDEVRSPKPLTSVAKLQMTEEDAEMAELLAPKRIERLANV